MPSGVKRATSAFMHPAVFAVMAPHAVLELDRSSCGAAPRTSGCVPRGRSSGWTSAVQSQPPLAMSSSVRPKKVEEAAVGEHQPVLWVDHGQQHRRVVGERAQLGVGILHVGDVAQRADDARRPLAVIDDHAAGHEPARGRRPARATAPRSGTSAACGGKARSEIAPMAVASSAWKQPSSAGRSVAERAVGEAEDLVQPRREIGAVGDHVPVPQPVAGAARRQRVALLGEPQPLVGLRPLDGAGDQRRRGLQDVDLERASRRARMAVVEGQEAPAAAAQHDGYRDEGRASRSPRRPGGCSR